jgi:hypothetical protein
VKKAVCLSGRPWRRRHHIRQFGAASVTKTRLAVHNTLSLLAFAGLEASHA